MKRPITIHIHTTVDVSEDYPDDSLLFMYNEGTHCINNDLERLVAQLHEDPWECQCPNAWITLGHAEHPYRKDQQS